MMQFFGTNFFAKSNLMDVIVFHDIICSFDFLCSLVERAQKLFGIKAFFVLKKWIKAYLQLRMGQPDSWRSWTLCGQQKHQTECHCGWFVKMLSMKDVIWTVSCEPSHCSSEKMSKSYLIQLFTCWFQASRLPRGLWAISFQLFYANIFIGLFSNHGYFSKMGLACHIAKVHTEVLPFISL